MYQSRRVSSAKATSSYSRVQKSKLSSSNRTLKIALAIGGVILLIIVSIFLAVFLLSEQNETSPSIPFSAHESEPVATDSNNIGGMVNITEDNISIKDGGAMSKTEDKPSMLGAVKIIKDKLSVKGGGAVNITKDKQSIKGRAVNITKDKRSMMPFFRLLKSNPRRSIAILIGFVVVAVTAITLGVVLSRSDSSIANINDINNGGKGDVDPHNDEITFTEDLTLSAQTIGLIIGGVILGVILIVGLIYLRIKKPFSSCASEPKGADDVFSVKEMAAIELIRRNVSPYWKFLNPEDFKIKSQNDLEEVKRRIIYNITIMNYLSTYTSAKKGDNNYLFNVQMDFSKSSYSGFNEKYLRGTKVIEVYGWLAKENPTFNPNASFVLTAKDRKTLLLDTIPDPVHSDIGSKTFPCALSAAFFLSDVVESHKLRSVYMTINGLATQILEKAVFKDIYKVNQTANLVLEQSNLFDPVI